MINDRYLSPGFGAGGPSETGKSNGSEEPGDAVVRTEAMERFYRSICKHFKAQVAQLKDLIPEKEEKYLESEEYFLNPHGFIGDVIIEPLFESFLEQRANKLKMPNNIEDKFEKHLEKNINSSERDIVDSLMAKGLGNDIVESHIRKVNDDVDSFDVDFQNLIQKRFDLLFHAIYLEATYRKKFNEEAYDLGFYSTGEVIWTITNSYKSSCGEEEIVNRAISLIRDEEEFDDITITTNTPIPKHGFDELRKLVPSTFTEINLPQEPTPMTISELMFKYKLGQPFNTVSASDFYQDLDKHARENNLEGVKDILGAFNSGFSSKPKAQEDFKLTVSTILDNLLYLLVGEKGKISETRIKIINEFLKYADPEFSPEYKKPSGEDYLVSERLMGDIMLGSISLNRIDSNLLVDFLSRSSNKFLTSKILFSLLTMQDDQYEGIIRTLVEKNKIDPYDRYDVEILGQERQGLSLIAYAEELGNWNMVAFLKDK